MQNRKAFLLRDKLLIFISDFFSSPVWIGALFSILLAGIVLTEPTPIGIIILVAVVFWLPAIVYSLVKSPDLDQIDQRTVYLVVILLAALAATGIGILAGSFLLLQQILLSITMIIAAFLLITPFWKVSLHAGLNSFPAYWAVILWGGLLVAPFVIILSCVTYSRVALKKHTPAQVIAGIIIPFIICGIVRLYF